MGRQGKLIVVAMLVLAVAGLDAQGTATLVRQRQPVRFTETWPVNGDTRIIGHVIDVRQIPVAFARVQLRNLVNGIVQQERESNEKGEFAFVVEDPGTYVVEMTLVDGYVVGLSEAALLLRFETLETVVQLPGRWEGASLGMVMPQNALSFIGMSAAATVTAQTMQIALQQDIQPVDPGEPVSPYKP